MTTEYHPNDGDFPDRHTQESGAEALTEHGRAPGTGNGKPALGAVVPSVPEQRGALVPVEVVDDVVWMPPVESLPRMRSRLRWKLPLALFVVTCLSTFAAASWDSITAGRWSAAVAEGLIYSASVMTILLCHEFGHYIQARRYGVSATLPYFIPCPIGPIGTCGAFIAMGSHVGNRRALFDIGISGPLAGLVPTLIFCVLGLHWSHPVAGQSPPPGEWVLGDSIFFAYLVQHLVHPGASQMTNLHPMAMAGWVGLLVTALNLVPIGQLDGGHVLYALSQEGSRRRPIAAADRVSLDTAWPVHVDTDGAPARLDGPPASAHCR